MRGEIEKQTNYIKIESCRDECRFGFAFIVVAFFLPFFSVVVAGKWCNKVYSLFTYKNDKIKTAKWIMKFMETREHIYEVLMAFATQN